MLFSCYSMKEKINKYVIVEYKINILLYDELNKYTTMNIHINIIKQNSKNKK